jgi:hypothetical protein
LLSAIFQANNIHGEESEKYFLQSLQPYVIQLRTKYQNSSVSIDYSDLKMQAAYLLAYYPGYIYQSHNTLNCHNVQDCLNIDSDSITISMFGCGPCPELVAIASFLSERFPHVKKIIANVFDIAVDTWKYSIGIAKEYLLPKIWDGEVIINYHPSFDLRSPCESGRIQCLAESKIVTFQNCINEIATDENKTQDIFAKNVESIVSILSANSIMLLSDLSKYKYVDKTLSKIEMNLNQIKYEITTNDQSGGYRFYDGSTPSKILAYLLTGENNLIEKRNIYYTSLGVFVNTDINNESGNEYKTLDLDRVQKRVAPPIRKSIQKVTSSPNLSPIISRPKPNLLPSLLKQF